MDSRTCRWFPARRPSPFSCAYARGCDGARAQVGRWPMNSRHQYTNCCSHKRLPLKGSDTIMKYYDRVQDIDRAGMVSKDKNIDRHVSRSRKTINMDIDRHVSRSPIIYEYPPQQAEAEGACTNDYNRMNNTNRSIYYLLS